MKLIHTKRVFQSLLLTVFATVFSVPGTSIVKAQDSVQAEVLIILAKEEAGTVDPSLAAMAALRRRPFNMYRSMRIVEKPRVRLEAGKDVDVKLPNGRQLRIHLEQVLPDGRYRVKVSINRPNQRDYLPLLQVIAAPGDPFFVAGQEHNGGTLVIGVRLQ